MLGIVSLLGPTYFLTRETIMQSIPGTCGVFSRTLDIFKAAQFAFLGVQQTP
jgi:hypothetical protein